MDYLLSREFDEQYIAICIVSRSVVVVRMSLSQDEALSKIYLKRDTTLSFDLSMKIIAQLSC